MALYTPWYITKYQEIELSNFISPIETSLPGLRTSSAITRQSSRQSALHNLIAQLSKDPNFILLY
jgi:hypothetical protein